MTDAQSPPDHLVFSPTIEELFVRRLGPRITPALRDQLRDLGLDLDKPLLPAYPLAAFDAALEVIATSVFSELPRAEAFRELGRLQVDAFAETLLGRASFQLMKLVSLTVFLNRQTRAWRNANNFIQTRLTESGPQTWEVWVNDVGRFPEVIQGILKAALERASHRAEVEILQREGLSCVYRVTVKESANS
jgi:uncharacterized protein (TIGR02265 family)